MQNCPAQTQRGSVLPQPVELGSDIYDTSLTRQRRYKRYKYAGKRLSSMFGIQLAAFIPVGHNADAVHGVVLVRGEGARDTVSVQVLVTL